MKNEEKKKKRKPLFSLEYLPFDFVRITAAPGLLWFRPKIIYESEAAKQKIRGGALLISNHIGLFDPMYLMMAVWYRRHRFICKKELMEHRLGFWLKLFRCISIDKNDMSFNSMRQVTDALRSGELVSMFPEGQVSLQSEAPAGFKSGMILMSLQGNAPIIPAYIKPRKHFYSRLVVVIGERFSVTDEYGPRPKFSQLDEAAARLHETDIRLAKLAEGKERTGK
ncbi:MAG: 1-acyl-sn-glycerol-3-phosphate acyltransferase [Clostridia bacterium]|nr:1-acyl-sn-glycerol-3-phosphate acyltransferase [Clostridia bacterium]